MTTHVRKQPARPSGSRRLLPTVLRRFGEYRTQLAGLSASGRFLPVLLLLFVGSGCSALIYEIVWFQLLQLVIGSSAVSLAVLLGTFMGGMCLGSIALPWVVSARQHPLRIYAALEVGIGVCGILVFFGMPYVDYLYVAGAGTGYWGLLLRGVVCAVCLLPPTMLMGATLPAVSRLIEATPAGVSWLGSFYGGNIAGAVFGCLLAGFYLLRVQDAETATYVAALTNGVVAMLGLGLAAFTPYAPPAAGPATKAGLLTPGTLSVYAAIALSGMSALAAEVVWTRILSLMLGATVYTFSIILAVFLIGLGIGSAIGSAVARSSTAPRVALGVCQVLLAGAVAWAAFVMAKSLPYWPINPALSRSSWIDFQLDLVRCMWAVLPASILWGASFPLALAAVATPGQDPGRAVGGVYAANTAGAIVGALGTSLWLIRAYGTQKTQGILVGLGAVAVVLLCLPALLRPFPLNAPGGPAKLVLRLAGACALIILAGLALQLGSVLPPVPPALVAYGRQLVTHGSDSEVYSDWGEGMTSSVAVSRYGATRYFHVAGKVEASTLPEDMRLQRMLGHLSALLQPKPRKVLVVGCGAGVTAGTFMVHPDIERVVICEIEPLVPELASKHFSAENYGVVTDKRTQVVIDDGRHFVLTTPEKFDVITSDPIHPWVKGAASLYTKEYFEMCKRKLNPGGIVTQWVPLYESDFDTVRSEIATFFEVFPNGTVWSNAIGGDGYDIVLLGQVEPLIIDLDEFAKRLESDDYRAVYQSLKDVGFEGPLDLLSTYGGRATELKPWLKGAEINRDRNLRLQYLAGMGLNWNLAVEIHSEMLHYRHFPEDLFTGSEERKQTLRWRMQ